MTSQKKIISKLREGYPRKGSHLPRLTGDHQGMQQGAPPAQTHWGKVRACAFLPGCRPRCLLVGSAARMRLSSTAR